MIRFVILWLLFYNTPNREIDLDVVIPYPIVVDQEAILGFVRDAGEKTLALLLTAMQAASVRDNQLMVPHQWIELCPDCFKALSPLKRVFISGVNLDSQMLVTISWRYEALATLE